MHASKYLTDTELVLAYQTNKNNQSYGEIYNRYYKQVYDVCLAKVKDKSNAEDITSDVFEKIADKITALRNPKLFKAWLMRIARNACMDFFRRRKHTIYVENNGFHHLAEDDSLMEKAMTKEQDLTKLEKTIAQLDEETKYLVIQKYLQKRTIENLEKELGISKSAVKMRLKRAREKMIKIWSKNSSINAFEFENKVAFNNI